MEETKGFYEGAKEAYGKYIGALFHGWGVKGSWGSLHNAATGEISKEIGWMGKTLRTAGMGLSAILMIPLGIANHVFQAGAWVTTKAGGRVIQSVRRHPVAAGVVAVAAAVGTGAAIINRHKNDAPEAPTTSQQRTDMMQQAYHNGAREGAQMASSVPMQPYSPTTNAALAHAGEQARQEGVGAEAGTQPAAAPLPGGSTASPAVVGRHTARLHQQQAGHAHDPHASVASARGA